MGHLRKIFTQSKHIWRCAFYGWKCNSADFKSADIVGWVLWQFNFKLHDDIVHLRIIPGAAFKKPHVGQSLCRLSHITSTRGRQLVNGDLPFSWKWQNLTAHQLHLRVALSG